MSFVLEVQLRIKPENVDRFMKQVLENAQHARKEPGCKQFDVLVDPHDRAQVMLYEVYTDERPSRRTSRRRISRSTSPRRCRCSPRARATSGAARADGPDL